MMLIRKLLLAASFGYAAQIPIAASALDCKDIGAQAITDSTQRLQFPASGFSVLPPQGDKWCIQRTDRDGIIFFKSPLLLDTNPRPARASASHTVVAMAKEVSIEESGLDSIEGLRDFVARWLRGGGNTRSLGSTLVLDDTPLARFKLVESRLDLKNPFSANCVGFDSVTEERDNPRYRGAVLLMVNRNQFLCRHPHARERLLVLIGYSERYMQGAPPPAGSLVDDWKEQLEPFVRSLQFSPLQ